MSSLFDFTRKIRQLTKEKKYNDALNFFKENKTEFSNIQIANNEYLISDILSCLRHTNYFDAGFLFLDTYGIEINKETKERVLTAYGWLLWSKYKAVNINSAKNINYDFNRFEEDESSGTSVNFHYDKTELMLKIEKLIPLLYALNSDFSRNLISFMFSIVLKSEKKKPTPNWKLINDFCNEFDPNNLSIECRTIEVERKGQKKDMELASDKENWFAYKTKALFKLGEWQECFDLSKRALDALDGFHYSNDIWFARRIALAKKNLGNSTETILELKIILKKKKEWFIQKELADIYFEENNIENAFKYAIQAITNFGPIEFKVDLLFLIGKILHKKNEKELAFKHFSLSKLIRQNEEWKIPQKVFDELRNFENVEIDIYDIGKLRSELKKYWGSLVPEKHKVIKSESLQGVILRFLHDNERGKDGFLKCGSNEYYFNLSANYHLTSKIDITTKVIFELCPSKVGKKEKARIKGIVA